MAAAAIIFVGIGFIIAAFSIGYGMGKSSVKPSKKKMKHPKENALIHPNSGRYCPICGIDTHKSSRFHDAKQHELPKAHYCHICGAGPGEKCDAGLHG